MQKIPTGLEIMSREMTPFELSAPRLRPGVKLKIAIVNIKFSFEKIFINPLFFIALETTNIYSLKNNDK